MVRLLPSADQPKILPSRPSTRPSLSEIVAASLRSQIARAALVLGLVGLLAGLVAYSVLSVGMGELLHLSTASLLVAAAAASLSSMIATGLSLFVVRIALHDVMNKDGKVPPTSSTPAPTSPSVPSASTLSIWLMTLLSFGSGRKDSPVMPALVAQMICHSAKAVSQLLVAALKEDDSGQAHRYVPCVLDCLLQLRLAVEDFAATLQSSFVCALPPSRKAHNVFLPTSRQRGDVDALSFRYKLHGSNDLSPQLQNILAAVQDAVAALVRAYCDELQADCCHGLRGLQSFSSPAVATALKDELARVALRPRS